MLYVRQLNCLVMFIWDLGPVKLVLVQMKGYVPSFAWLHGVVPGVLFACSFFSSFFSLNPDKAQTLWCTLDNRTAGKPMPAVTYDGAVAERTSHLRHLGIYFDRMLTYRKHVETTALHCKLWLQRALSNATFPTVSKCGAQCHWLRTKPHNNGTDKSAKAGQSAERGNTGCILGTTKDTPTETVRFMLDSHQRKPDGKWSRPKILQCHRKSLQPTPRNRERYKGMQTGTGQVLDGSSRGLNTASMPADRAQANQGVGKVPKPIPMSLWDTPDRKLGKALLRMSSRHTHSPLYSGHFCFSHSSLQTSTVTKTLKLIQYNSSRKCIKQQHWH